MLEIRTIKAVFEWIHDLGNLYGEVTKAERDARFCRTPVSLDRRSELERIRADLEQQGKPAFVRQLLLD